MGIRYKVWVQIEMIDEDEDLYERVYDEDVYETGNEQKAHEYAADLEQFAYDLAAKVRFDGK